MRTSLWIPVAAVLTAVLAGCAGSSDRPAPGTQAGTPATDGGLTGEITPLPGMDPQLLAPLTALGPCTADISPATATPPTALVLPPGAVLTELEEADPLVNVQGYVPLTPIQTRVFYQQLDGVDILQVEDEIREAEVLLSRGDTRLFFKSQAVCEQGSVFVAVLAPELADAQVPTPQGGGGVTTEAPE